MLQLYSVDVDVSANVAALTCDGIGISAIYREYKRGSRTWGTPESIGKLKELASRYITLKIPLVRYD